MKLHNILVLTLLSIALTACPSKNKDAEVSNEPVEGASSANTEQSAEGGTDEMQEKKGEDAAPAGGEAAPAEPAKE